jgi:hypothetical protein
MCLICIIKRAYTKFRDELKQTIKIIIIICLMLEVICLCINKIIRVIR